MTPAHEAILTEMRTLVRDARQVATCVGFGPRFQHSTGQTYKGGPNTGIFLQITCDDAVEVTVPGHRYTFWVVKQAAASSDLQVLGARGRRALRVHLGANVTSGLEQSPRRARRGDRRGQRSPISEPLIALQPPPSFRRGRHRPVAVSPQARPVRSLAQPSGAQVSTVLHARSVREGSTDRVRAAAS